MPRHNYNTRSALEMRVKTAQGERAHAWRARAPRWALPCALIALALAGCASAPGGQSRAAAPREPVKVMPQRDWSDAVLYFVVLDRFFDGSSANDFKVDRANPGGFHGGDLRGLTAKLDEIASLGATAIWITPVVQQIAQFLPFQLMIYFPVQLVLGLLPPDAILRNFALGLMWLTIAYGLFNLVWRRGVRRFSAVGA
jgi:hypothetical protein